MSPDHIAAVAFFTPLVLICLVGVRDLHSYMLNAVYPWGGRKQQVVLLLGGIGWIELAALFGRGPQVFQIFFPNYIDVHVVDTCAVVASGLVLLGLVLIRAGRSIHPRRTAVVYIIAIAFSALVVGASLWAPR